MDYEGNDKELRGRIRISGYWVLPNISIDGTATGVGAHNWTWAVSQGWCQGSGTWGAPYVIENITINGQNKSICIYISSSKAYFVIRNCTLTNSSAGASDQDSNAGIFLENVSNGTLINNTCCFNNWNGISIKDCGNLTVKQNHIYNNTRRGIDITTSDNNTILSNRVENNSYGIYINGLFSSHANKNNIIDNTVLNHKINGIQLYTLCHENNISLNEVKFNGGRGIYIGQSGSSGYGCNNNIVYKNDVIDNMYGVRIDSGSDNNTILKNNILFNREEALEVWNSNYTNVRENVVNNNKGGFGITLSNTNCTKLEKNQICYNGEGGFGGISAKDSNNLTIDDNDVNNNIGRGIAIQTSTNVSITNNDVNNNVEHPILHMGEGIFVYKMNDSKIIGNRIYNNDATGISLQRSKNNLVIQNKLCGNKECIVEDSYCSGNTVTPNDCSCPEVPDDDDSAGDDSGKSNATVSIPSYDILVLVGALSMSVAIITLTKRRDKSLKSL